MCWPPYAWQSQKINFLLQEVYLKPNVERVSCHDTTGMPESR